jgi:hypothetical protein
MAEKQRKPIDRLRDAIHDHQPIPESPRRTETPDALRRAMEASGRRPLTQLEREIAPMQIPQGNQMINKIVMGWLSEDYLGPSVYQSFTMHAPELVTKPVSFFEEIRDRYGLPFVPSGFSPHGSDEIYVVNTLTDVANRFELVAHEQLHQASELGGGLTTIFWRDNNRTITLEGESYPSWLHEGMTELHAQQLTRANGMEPSFVAYPHQTVVCFFMQQMVIDQVGSEELGKAIVRDAYLTGDFTQVALYVDSYLGAGSFEQLMRLPDSITAASWLWDHMEQRLGNGLLSFRGSASYLNWFDDPIVRRAMAAFGFDASDIRRAVQDLSRRSD